MITVALKERTGELLPAAQAVLSHQKGDRYIDTHTKVRLRLHQQRVPDGPQPHYEFEPRWNQS